MLTLEKALKEDIYPGRGIVVGFNKTFKEAFLAYFIMGRSENSRNRIFKLDKENNLKTVPFKEEKIENKDLIIYTAVTKYKDITIISNGSHTETILKGISNKKNFEESLKETTYEEDPPILTPRISAIIDLSKTPYYYSFSIIKNNNKERNSVKRFFFQFENPTKGVGHLIHTYKGVENGNPKSFSGEPVELELPEKFEEFKNTVWESLNNENKISLFVRSINVETKEEITKIINKNVN